MSSKSHELEKDKQIPKHGRDLTTGSIPRHLMVFSIPLLMGSIFQTLYGIVNAIWVGQGLGKDGMAAITVSIPIFFVLMAAAIGLTMAAQILVSQSYGARDWDGLKRAVRNSVILTVVLSTVCSLAGFVWAEPLLKLMKTQSNVLPMALPYMRLFLWTMPMMFGMFLMVSLLRGTGDSVTPLYFQGVSLAVNAILDPILMFGWLGAPEMGLNGTAVATIISQSGALLAIVLYLERKKHVAAPDFRNLRPDWATSSLLLRIGVPSMAQQALISMGFFALMTLVNEFGESGTAAFGAAIRIDQLAFMPGMMIGMAASTLAGQNIGAKEYDRVKEVFKWAMLLSCGITLVVSLLVVGMPGLLLKMFLKEQSVIDMGAVYLRIVGGGYLLLAAMFVTNGIINGAGHTFVTTLVSLVALWAVRIPLASYLSHSMHRIEGIWYGMLISFAVGTAISMAYYLSGRWKRPLRGTSAYPGPVKAGLLAEEKLMQAPEPMAEVRLE